MSRPGSNRNGVTGHLRPNPTPSVFYLSFFLKIALKKHRFPGAAGSSSTRPEDPNCNYSSNDSCPALPWRKLPALPGNGRNMSRGDVIAAGEHSCRRRGRTQHLKTLFHSHTRSPQLKSRGMFPSHARKPGVTLERHTERVSPARRGRTSDDSGDRSQTWLKQSEVGIPRCYSDPTTEIPSGFLDDWKSHVTFI